MFFEKPTIQKKLMHYTIASDVSQKKIFMHIIFLFNNSTAIFNCVAIVSNTMNYGLFFMHAVFDFLTDFLDGCFLVDRPRCASCFSAVVS